MFWIRGQLVPIMVFNLFEPPPPPKKKKGLFVNDFQQEAYFEEFLNHNKIGLYYNY